MGNMSPIFIGKGCGGCRNVKLYPNRIECTKPNLLFGKHVETIHLKDIVDIGKT